MPDISEYVVLFHGDLGTGEQLQAVQQCCSIEGSPWNCFQHVIFCPGLFHLNMASVDAIWQTFLQLSAAREDKMSLMHDIGVLQPCETGIYGSKPGFRRMHQLITYDGICQRLDCWRVEVRKLNHDSLEAFALSEPSFNDLKTITNRLARDYITNHQLCQM
ncbi:hypothetical protein PAXRUDRAFT_788451 [Paxillus rubicundulus Ve08.2h10]|uniref:DUF6589 domain-containing protein n=1 Tax=Paxillus rubicundulus Ve08.2h10 TaxID=930991 RepID=A0A0D0D4H3_9AGAM|nr:hypothetical protein PAXRUDRAFT_788451 [Paxillus rubicundulus Ve08.2h10]